MSSYKKYFPSKYYKATDVEDGPLDLTIKEFCPEVVQEGEPKKPCVTFVVQMLAFSEGVLLAEKSGIKRETAVEVLLNSVIASPMVKYRGPFVLDMPDEAWFDVNMMQKDLSLALELGKQMDVPLPTTSVTNEFLTAARGMGLQDQDFAVIFEVLAAMSGVSKR